MNKNEVRIGGLFRCCVETAETYDGAEPQNGSILSCKYCKDGVLVWRDGAWEWSRLADLRAKQKTAG